ncbi:DoxX family protein [Amycolatopsis suaedae]|uniref:DoxX family protein n=1 Tax=Amycolatopsis suaedae TaxID=2510978 RepID=A0A4Q7JE24_9PSEU|nr:DoxX family protein [Amycolatopsis suaedae]RZQ65342.1 DoxX family protein [Amycolatopsis suaedae]
MTTITRETAARTTSTNTTTDRLRGYGIAAARVAFSVLFLMHGLQGFGFFGGIDGAGAAVEFGSWPGWFATVIETVGPLLVAAGLFTRTAAVICSGAMAYAYFVVHQPMGLLPMQNMGEQAALYAWVFLLIAVVGPGACALDNLRKRR